MKKYIALILLILPLLGLTQPLMRVTSSTKFFYPGFHLTTPSDQVTKDTTLVGWNMRETYYFARTDSSEAIVYWPGAGEVGTDPSLLLKYGPHQWIASGWDGGVQLGNGVHYPLLFSIQPPSQSVLTGPNLKTRIDALFARFPKIKRWGFYMTGPSAGGFATWTFVTYQATAGNFSGYGDRVTAVMCPESVKPNSQQAATPAYPQNTVQWIVLPGTFHRRALGFDQTGDSGRDMFTYYNAMNTAAPGYATYYQTDFGTGGHCCFAEFWDPSNIHWPSLAFSQPVGPGIPDGWNTYQWLLRSGDTSLASSPPAPIVTGTGSASLTLPTNSANIGCTVSSGTSPYNFLWTKVGGPATYTITPNVNAQNIGVSGLVAGNYIFRVIVTDANGQTGSADVPVNVSAGAITNPTANAGSDQVVTLPTATASLNGTASTANAGSITAYSWLQIAGTSLTLTTPTASTTGITGITLAGVYKFSLTVTNTAGGTNTDTVQLTVNPNPTGGALQANVALYGGSNGFNDPAWNLWNDSASLTKAQIFYTGGGLSPWSLSMDFQTSSLDNGATYGNSVSGLIAPQQVLRNVSFLSGSGVRNFSLSGLDPSQRYTIEFVCSRNSGSVNNMNAWIGTDTLSINTSNQLTSSLLWINKAPNSQGVMKIVLQRQAGSVGTYVNAIKITQQGGLVNTSPSAFAGQDQLISIPQDSTVVSGFGTDPDDGDSVVRWNWQIVSGPRLDTLVIVNPDSATTLIKHLVPGTYIFKFTAFDTHGASGVDTLKIIATSDTGRVQIVAMKDTTLGRQQYRGHGILYPGRDTTQMVFFATAGPNTTSYRWRQLWGPVNIHFGDSTQRSTNAFDFTQTGMYAFEVMGKNSTDSAKDSVYVRVVDYNVDYSKTPCRSGAPQTFTLTATGPTSLFKYHIKRDVFHNSGADPTDHPMGGDTIFIAANTANGGTYNSIRMGGFGGSEGCPIVVVPQDPIVAASIGGATSDFRIGGMDDSAAVSWVIFDGTYLQKRGIRYGFVHEDAFYNQNSIGLAINQADHVTIQGFYIHRMGVSLFCKNNPDSTHPSTLFNIDRFYSMKIVYNFFDSTGNGEGVYAGNTSPDGKTGAGGGKGPSTRVDSIEFAFNIVRMTGFDGGQFVNCVYLLNHDNFYLYTGIANATSQRFMSQMGGNTQGKVYNNVFWNGKEGVTGTPFGFCEFYNNFIDSVYTGGTGAGRSHGMTMFGAPFGTMAGSTIVEVRDSFYVWIHDNIVVKADSFYIRVHNQGLANSITHPSLIYRNHIIDGTNRTLAQLIFNISGSQYNTANTLHNLGSFPIALTDLSTSAVGPMVQIQQGSATQTFTDAASVVNWLRSRLEATPSGRSYILRKRPFILRKN